MNIFKLCLLINHRLTEYPKGEGTHQGPAQDIPTIPPCTWALSKCYWSSGSPGELFQRGKNFFPKYPTQSSPDTDPALQSGKRKLPLALGIFGVSSSGISRVWVNKSILGVLQRVPIRRVLGLGHGAAPQVSKARLDSGRCPCPGPAGGGTGGIQCPSHPNHPAVLGFWDSPLQGQGWGWVKAKAAVTVPAPQVTGEGQQMSCSGRGKWGGSLLPSGFWCLLKQPLFFFFFPGINYIFYSFSAQKGAVWSPDGDVSKQRCFPTTSVRNSDFFTFFFFSYFCSNKTNSLQFVSGRLCHDFPSLAASPHLRGGV